MGWFGFFGGKSEMVADKPANASPPAIQKATPAPPKPGSKTTVSPLGNRTSHTASGTEITRTTTGRKIFKTTEETEKGSVTKTYTYEREDLNRPKKKGEQA